MLYTPNRYIYPPRPENVIPSTSIELFDTSEFLGQAKFNGSCSIIHGNKKKNTMQTYNRHNQIMSNFKVSKDEIFSMIPNDNWFVFVAEYMNKGKKDENNKNWNNRIALHDFLVYDNEYIIGSTFDDRQNLMDKIIKSEELNMYATKVSDNIYRIKNFYKDFFKIWTELIKIDMIEGLVLKKRDLKLEAGWKEKNNLSIKCRKISKNYNF